MTFSQFFPPSTVDAWTMLKGIWAPHLWVLVASMALAMALTPVVRTIAMRTRVYDMPDERLKTHKRPIPYLGGIAIFLAWAVPVLFVAISQTLHPGGLPAETAEAVRLTRGGAVMTPVTWIEEPTRLFWIVGAAGLIMLLGLYDDLRDLPPRLRILGQIIAALLLAAGGIVFMAFPKRIGDVSLFPTDAWWVFAMGIGVQIALVVGAANATNLLDGLDGLCSGVTAFISVGFLLVATSLLGWDLYRSGTMHYSHAEIIVLMSFALLGAVLGFLPYNFNPASIFMGDAGSMFLGFLSATFMILFSENFVSVKWFLAAMVIFGLPIFDTGLALVRRLVNHKPIFAGDRSHFYDQLVDRGCSVRVSVLINYGLSVVFGLLGLAAVFLRLRFTIIIYVVVFAAIAIAALKMGLVRVDEQKPKEKAGGTAGGLPADDHER